MSRKAMSALDALARYEEQQQIARETGESLRRAAALELGTIVLEAGGSSLGSDGVRRAIAAAVATQRPPSGSDRTAGVGTPGHG
jgi:hypothetical protein